MHPVCHVQADQDGVPSLCDDDAAGCSATQEQAQRQPQRQLQEQPQGQLPDAALINLLTTGCCEDASEGAEGGSSTCTLPCPCTSAWLRCCLMQAPVDEVRFQGLALAVPLRRP